MLFTAYRFTLVPLKGFISLLYILCTHSLLCHKNHPGKDDIAEMIDFLTEEGKCEISELEMNLLVLTLNQLKIRIQQIVSGAESSNCFDFCIQDFYIYRYHNKVKLTETLVQSEIANKGSTK